MCLGCTAQKWGFGYQPPSALQQVKRSGTHGLGSRVDVFWHCLKAKQQYGVGVRVKSKSGAQKKREKSLANLFLLGCFKISHRNEAVAFLEGCKTLCFARA